MKHILAGIFTIGTALASYSTYKSDQFGPILAEIQKARLPFLQGPNHSRFDGPPDGIQS